MNAFARAKREFDESLGSARDLSNSLVPVHGKSRCDIQIRGQNDYPLEEYYKWQFIYALIHSGLYTKDYIGTEIHFPKGSKGARDLIVDGAIFDDKEWLQRYNDYWQYRHIDNLQWLNDHLLAIIEFKRGEKDIGRVFTRQIKPAMREKDPSDAYVLGMYYDEGRLTLFHRREGRYLRYDERKNEKAENSKANELSLHMPDPYDFIPSFGELRDRIQRPSLNDRSNRGITDLDVITSIAAQQMRDALSHVLRTLDKAGLVNQRGYEILIQVSALKISDEKRNERNPSTPLTFFAEEDELSFESLEDPAIQRFIDRMKKIKEAALSQYQTLLDRWVIDWKDVDQVRVVISVCQSFQDFSFVRSSKSDLYQLVFYNFANQFQQQEKAQFLTPLPVIDFLVSIVNPRNNETVFDPCCGIGDFLSLAFVNSQTKTSPWQLDDENIYGTDVSGDMITLASLNMILNGDGRAHLFRVSDKGSILWKIANGNPPTPVKLIPERHKGGNWDDWPDRTSLLKFDVILTNPPFGEDRAYRPNSEYERQLIEAYEVWSLGSGDSIDLGVVFLEAFLKLFFWVGSLEQQVDHNDVYKGFAIAS